MSLIYNYHPGTGEYLGNTPANASPREAGVMLVPAFATVSEPPRAGERACACFLDTDGSVPADYQAGSWHLVPDWRGVALWDTASGAPVTISLPGVTPGGIGATAEQRTDPTTTWNGNAWVADHTLARQQLLDLRAATLAAINDKAASLLRELSAAYPEGEVQSWAQQTREAEALALDADAPVPLLGAIARARALDVGELAARVRTKTAAYTQASGRIIGQRQALEAALMAIDADAPDARARLAAICWPPAAGAG